MHSLAAPSAHPVVSLVDGQAVTTSLEVARVFGKTHQHVLRDIENLMAQLPPEALSNFGQGSYTLAATGDQQHKQYTLTRDGFTLLAMGFTGKRALQFKLAYIAEFNRLEAQSTQVALPSPDIAAARIEALAAGFVVEREVVKAILSGNRHLRMVSWLLPDGGAEAKPIAHDAMIGSLADIARMIAAPDAPPHRDSDLAAVAKACIDRLAARLQRRSRP